MKNTYLLSNKFSLNLYEDIKTCPIIDYHCHLSPKEIFEDKVYNNLGEMWLNGDHYKWRLMRAYGVNEQYITGSATWHEKFIKYAQTISMAAGNPLYHWSNMELNMFFGIEESLNSRSAEAIWEKANKVIREKQLSPRKLIILSKVEYIATTDDMTDDLSYHQKIRDDLSFQVKVAPSFRTDNALLIRRSEYRDYIKKISFASGIEIVDLNTLKVAICKRLDFFCSMGCTFTDIGIEYFPDRISDIESADQTFKRAMDGKEILYKDFLGFLGYMYLFLAGEYKKRNLVMQWHLAVKRNANTEMFHKLSADCGGDCIGDVIPNQHIISMLDAINSGSGLPKTILYTLNPTMSASLSTIAGSFPNVICGAAWWFCDHKRGISEQILNICETGHIGTFLGMLTDSRSFLSYARHDYFRRILCDIIGEFVEKGEFAEVEDALNLVRNICYGNIKKLIGDENL